LYEKFVRKNIDEIDTSKLKAPPKSCIPSSAKMRMKRKRRKRREMMDLIELNNEMTRFRSEDQYLKKKKLLSIVVIKNVKAFIVIRVFSH